MAVTRPTAAVATSARVALAAHGAVAAALFAAFFLRFHLLWDSDSYYHLAVARLYAQHGPLARIPWPRFSLLGNGGDKDFLFHLLLAPFAALPDAAVGGRLALSLFNAALATALAALAVRAIGAVGYLVPLWLWIAAPPLLARTARLRPELLALLVILLAIPAAARRSGPALGTLAWAFALGYTAFHVFLALCVLWFAWAWYRERRPDARLLVAPLVGTAAGLLLRPHPLANLEIWFVQNVSLIGNLSTLEVADEMRPPEHLAVALACAGWFAGLAALWWLRRRDDPPATATDPATPLATLAALVFTILWLRFARMTTYVFPLATVAALLAIGRVRAVAAGALLATGLLALPLAADPMLLRLLGGRASSEREWAAFGRAVPVGARVAADWGTGELYCFWAPQGRYLNALDPVFMALPYPRRYAAQRWVFAGVEPDVPATVRRDLDSDFLAFDRTLVPRALLARVASDPRFETLYGGYELLLRIRPSDRFLGDWQGLRAPPAPPPGFVDAMPLPPGGCAVVSREEVVPGTAGETLEFAPWGPSQLLIDNRLAAASKRLAGAILGTGARVVVPAGRHRLQVRTCEAGSRAGFYLVRR